MIVLDNSRIRVEYDLCQQCGACIAVCPANALDFSRNKKGLMKISVNAERCILCQRCLRACPATKRDSFDGYFDNAPADTYYLGCNADADVTRKASSGGVARTLIVESLRSGAVDGVYAVAPDDTYPFARGRFFSSKNAPGYDDLSTSVYHSVAACLGLASVAKCRNLMIVGTSCQLRALDTALKGRFDNIIKVCIFCKQQKTLDSTRFLAKLVKRKISPDRPFSVSYRGAGWPGIVRINGGEIRYSRAAQLPFGRRLWTVPGCDACGDPFGQFAGADIALTDPWEIERANDRGHTVVRAMSPAGRNLLDKCPQLELIPRTYEEIRPALDFTGIKRKQALVPYFRGEKTPAHIAAAGRAERMQRAMLSFVVDSLPRMPMIFYRALCKLPDLRNLLLGKP